MKVLPEPAPEPEIATPSDDIEDADAPAEPAIVAAVDGDDIEAESEAVNMLHTLIVW